MVISKETLWSSGCSTTVEYKPDDKEVVCLNVAMNWPFSRLFLALVSLSSVCAEPSRRDIDFFIKRFLAAQLGAN